MRRRARPENRRQRRKRERFVEEGATPRRASSARYVLWAVLLVALVVLARLVVPIFRHH